MLGGPEQVTDPLNAAWSGNPLREEKPDEHVTGRPIGQLNWAFWQSCHKANTIQFATFCSKLAEIWGDFSGFETFGRRPLGKITWKQEKFQDKKNSLKMVHQNLRIPSRAPIHVAQALT